MKTRSNHIGGWRHRFRVFDWPLLTASVVLMASTVAAVTLAVYLAGGAR